MVKFEVGKTYTYENDADCYDTYRFEVVKRTAKFITIDTRMFDEPRRVGIFTYEGREAARPFGQYSMCPTIYADEPESNE